MLMLVKDSSMRDWIKPRANIVCHMVNVENGAWAWAGKPGKAVSSMAVAWWGSSPKSGVDKQEFVSNSESGCLGREEQDGSVCNR